MRIERKLLALSLSIAAIGLVGCGDSGTNPDGGSTDSGVPTDGGGGVDLGGGGGNDCTTYCSQLAANCTGDNAQYNDTTECMAYCAAAGWPAGTGGAMSGNTLACRVYHSGAPATMDPVLHCPHAGPTGSGVCGTVGFRTDMPTAYMRVDRMGMPAVSTALVPTASKNDYNDADPVDDATMRFAVGMLGTLTSLHTALDDDITGLGYTPCSMTTLVGGLPECVGQEIAPGVSVASLVIPDTLQINPAQTAGFPNGRKLADPVIDVTLAVILLRIGAPCGSATCSPATLAMRPLNPPMNDATFGTTFPYLATLHPAP